MKVLICFSMLLAFLVMSEPAYAAFKPAARKPIPKWVSLVNQPQLRMLAALNEKAITPAALQRKHGIKGKLIAGILKFKILRKLAGIDAPTARQRKLGKLSLICAGAAIVFLLIPYAALAIPAAIGIVSLPLAIAGLVLGIQSIQGNSNGMGLVGVILSASMLLLMVLSVIFVAIFFTGGWI